MDSPSGFGVKGRHKGKPGAWEKPQKRRRTIGFMPLEPRIMYDGAAAATAAHHHADSGWHHAEGPQPTVQGAPAGSQRVIVHSAPDVPVGAPTPATDTSGPVTTSGTTGPMPHVATWVRHPSEILFIDSAVPDYQSLVSGAKPGVEVVVLDANSDGVQQIADFLSAHPDPNLATIDIVAHGVQGEVRLGSTILTDADMAGESAALAQIGAALKPGGDILLYSCDVASGMAGMQFIADLSAATGGADIGAATHDIGLTANGESWSLDASTGAPIVTAAPFTDATLASYQGLLNSVPTTEIWVAGTGGGTADTIMHGDNTGNNIASNIITLFGQSTANNPNLQTIDSIELDPVNGLFFITTNNGNESKILEGSLSQVANLDPTNPADKPVFTTLYDATHLGGVEGIALDPVNHYVYFIDDNGGTTTSNFDRINYATPNQTPTVLGSVVGAALHNVALDLVHGKAYFFSNETTTTYAHSAPFTTPTFGTAHLATIVDQNALYVDSNIAATGATLSQLPVAPPDGTLGGNNFPVSKGEISGVAVDPVDQVLYFTTQIVTENGTTGTGGIYSYSTASTNSAGNYTAVYTENHVNSATDPVFSDIAVDPSTGKYYVSDTNQHGAHAVDIGSVIGGAPTVFLTIPQGAAPMSPEGISIDNAPVLTASGSTVTWDQGGATVTVDSGHAITVTDADSALLSNGVASFPSATVSVTNFQSGDVLGIPSADLTGGKVTGTNITPSYDAVHGVLTLTGIDTAAHYETALDDVTFSNTATAPSATPRTITFAVSDGLLSGTATDTVDLHVDPIIGNTGNTADFWQSHNAAATLDGAITVTDPNGVNITGATLTLTGSFSTGDVLADNGVSNGGTVLGNITASYDSTSHVLTLSGSDTALHYQTALQEVTYDFTGDPTNAGANPTRAIAWSVTDANNQTSLLGSSTTVDVFATPVLAAGAAGTPTVTSTSGAQTADSTLTVTDDNAIGSTPVATVTISSGSQPGDVLFIPGSDLTGNTVNGTTTITVSGNNSTTLTLTGTGSTTAAQFANALEEVQFNATNPHSGTRGLTWSFNDDAGGHTNDSNSLATNVDAEFGPTVTSGPAVTGTEGASTGTVTLATFTDGSITSPTVGDFTATIDWGDGTPTSSGAIAAGNGGTFTVSSTGHTYAEEGPYTVTVSVTDSNNIKGSTTDGATIADAALTPGTATVSGGVEGVTAATLSATFSDANLGATASDFSGTIDWGDGSAQTTFTSGAVGGSNGAFTVSGITHLYAEDGTYTPVVTINDKSTSSATEAGTATVADALLTPGTATVTGGVEGVTAATLSATFSDANLGATASDFSGTIDWGDGSAQTTFTSGAVSGSNGAFTVSGITHLYAEDGTYTPVVTINDKGTGSATETGTTTVADAPLTPGTATVTGGVEGVTAATLSATFSDANLGATASDFSGTIDWGDGSAQTTFTSGAVSGSNGAFTVSGITHLYAEDGTYTPVVTINDKGTGSATETGTTTVADAPLTPGTATVTGGVEGVTAATLSATFSDANLGATASDFSGTIDWGDGSAQTTFTSGAVSGSNGAFTVSGITHLYAEDGTYTPVVTINDKGTSAATETGTATVADAALTPGTATLTGGVEGITATTLSATFSDANLGATTADYSGTIDWGDGNTTSFTSAAVTGSNGNFTVSGSHQYAEDGSHTATVTINDDGGSAATETGTATVADAPLTPGTATLTGGIEGATATTLTATISDANLGATTSDYSGTINWGDGTTTPFTSAAVTGSNGNFTVSGSHQYAEEGSYIATVTINDAGGSAATETGTATVADAALTATATTFGGTGGVSTGTVTVATFTDANPNAPLNDFTATIAWGDGASSAGSVTENAGVFSVAGTHTYVTDGQYTPVVSITDVGGSTAQVNDTADITPVPPAITSLVGLPVNAGTVEIKGTGQVGDTVDLYADGNTTTVVGFGTVVAGGTFDITTTATFLDGVHTFTATQTDSAHLTSTASSPAFTVDVAPTLSAGGTVAYTQNGPPTALDTAVTADPGDTGGHLGGATVSIGAGFATGDVLNFANQNGISGSYDAAHGVLTLTGTASILDYNAALASITFSSTSPNPTNDGADPARTISWSVNDGDPTNNVSAPVTSTVDVHAVPTVVAGADVSYNARPGTSVVLDAPIGAYDDTHLTGATVTIASGFAAGDTLSADTSGTHITASYSNGVLTLTGNDTPQNYNAVLAKVTFSSSQPQSTRVTIGWQITDQNNHTSLPASSTVHVGGNIVAPPSTTPENVPPPGNTEGFGAQGFFGMVTNVQGGGGPTGPFFGQGPEVFVVHSDVQTAFLPDGTIDFTAPLAALDGPLDGDVVSVVATLPDGSPLPDWLKFNAVTGKFAGQIPDDILTAGVPGGNGGALSHVQTEITVQVTATDSRGNTALVTFTVDLFPPAPTPGPGGALEPWQHHALAPAGDLVLPDVGTLHRADHPPVGRLGFSDQMKGIGWRAMHASAGAVGAAPSPIALRRGLRTCRGAKAAMAW